MHIFYTINISISLSIDMFRFFRLEKHALHLNVPFVDNIKKEKYDFFWKKKSKTFILTDISVRAVRHGTGPFTLHTPGSCNQ